MSVSEFLVARGCSFVDERFDAILVFLARAEIECPDDFIGLRAIAETVDAEALKAEEVELLQNVVSSVSDNQQREVFEPVSRRPQVVERAASMEPDSKWRKLEKQLRGSKASDLDIETRLQSSWCFAGGECEAWFGQTGMD